MSVPPFFRWLAISYCLTFFCHELCQKVSWEFCISHFSSFSLPFDEFSLVTNCRKFFSNACCKHSLVYLYIPRLLCTLLYIFIYYILYIMFIYYKLYLVSLFIIVWLSFFFSSTLLVCLGTPGFGAIHAAWLDWLICSSCRPWKILRHRRPYVLPGFCRIRRCDPPLFCSVLLSLGLACHTPRALQSRIFFETRQSSPCAPFCEKSRSDRISPVARGVVRGVVVPRDRWEASVFEVYPPFVQDRLCCWHLPPPLCSTALFPGHPPCQRHPEHWRVVDQFVF